MEEKEPQGVSQASQGIPDKMRAVAFAGCRRCLFGKISDVVGSGTDGKVTDDKKTKSIDQPRVHATAEAIAGTAAHVWVWDGAVFQTRQNGRVACSCQNYVSNAGYTGGWQNVSRDPMCCLFVMDRDVRAANSN